MCTCVYVRAYARVSRARRDFLWLISGKCAAFLFILRWKGLKVWETSCVRKFLIHNYTYTYMFINRIIDWELFLSALSSRSLSALFTASVYIIYKYTYTYTYTYTRRIYASRRIGRLGEMICVYGRKKTREKRRLEKETRMNEQWSCGTDARAIS